MATTVSEKNAIDWEMVLGEFCAKEECRFGIQTPWKLDDGRVVASCGRVIIFLDKGICDKAAVDGDRRPNVKHLLEPFKFKYLWEPWPQMPDCKVCDGVGLVTSPCTNENCLGGMCGCDCCESDRECKICDGLGIIEEICEECPVKFKEGNVARIYANKISKLPNVKYVEIKDRILFYFDCGGGVVMKAMPRR